MSLSFYTVTRFLDVTRPWRTRSLRVEGSGDGLPGMDYLWVRALRVVTHGLGWSG